MNIIERFFTAVLDIIGFNLAWLTDRSASAARQLARLLRNILYVTIATLVVGLTGALVLSLTSALLDWGGWMNAIRWFLLVLFFVYQIIFWILTLSERGIQSAALLAGVDAVSNTMLYLRGLKLVFDPKNHKYDVIPNPDPRNPDLDWAALYRVTFAVRTLVAMLMMAFEFLMIVPVFSYGWLGWFTIFTGIFWMYRHRPTELDFVSWLGSFNGYAFVGLSAYMVAHSMGFPFPVLFGAAAFLAITLAANPDFRDRKYLTPSLIAAAIVLIPLLWSKGYLSLSYLGSIGTGIYLPFLSPEMNDRIFNPNPYFGWALAGLLLAAALTIGWGKKSLLKSVFSGAFLLLAGAYAVLVVVPITNWDATKWQIESNRRLFRTATALQSEEIQQVGRPVVASFVNPTTGKITTDPNVLGNAVMGQADKAHLFQRKLNEFELRSKGLMVGDFRVRASDVQIRMDGTGWFPTNRRVCGETTITVSGSVNTNHGFPDIDRNTGPMGYALPDRLRPISARSFQLVDPQSPFMATLVKVGHEVFSDWEHAEGDTYQMVLTDGSCGPEDEIFIGFNDLLTDDAGVYRPNFQASNAGENTFIVRSKGGSN